MSHNLSNYKDNERVNSSKGHIFWGSNAIPTKLNDINYDKKCIISTHSMTHSSVPHALLRYLLAADQHVMLVTDYTSVTGT